MNLPEQPPTFRQPTAGRAPVVVAARGRRRRRGRRAEEFAGQRFPTQADAESWVGEIWADLAEAGVDAVTLFELERQVYGPMSLHA